MITTEIDAAAISTKSPAAPQPYRGGLNSIFAPQSVAVIGATEAHLTNSSGSDSVHAAIAIDAAQ